MTAFSEHESLFAWLEGGTCCFGFICTSYDPILSGSFPKSASKPSVYLPPFEKIHRIEAASSRKSNAVASWSFNYNRACSVSTYSPLVSTHPPTYPLPPNIPHPPPISPSPVRPAQTSPA